MIAHHFSITPRNDDAKKLISNLIFRIFFFFFDSKCNQKKEELRESLKKHFMIGFLIDLEEKKYVSKHDIFEREQNSS